MSKCHLRHLPTLLWSLLHSFTERCHDNIVRDGDDDDDDDG